VGDTITTSSFYVSSVLNALPTTGGTLSGNLVVSGTETVSTITSPSATALTLQTNNGTTAITVDTSQNVGIGTTSPSYPLTVVSNSSAVGLATYGRSSDNLAGTYYFSNNGATTYGTILASATEFRLTSTPAAAVQTFYTNGTERMRIDSSGNLLVGTTFAVAQITSVSSSAATAAGYFNVNAASSTATPAIYARKYDNNNTTAQIYVSFQYNQGSGGAGGIQGNGATGVQFFSSSDARLKENVVALEPQLQNILSLKPSKFDYIDGPKNCTGFIAQEMEVVYPDVIGETPDGYKTIGGISIMETRLIKAIQEQQALITQLQADVAALKGTP